MKKPALDPATLAVKKGWDAPEPFRSKARNREKRVLGDPLGLTQFGVNLVTLEPGDQSSIRHWHSHEDEFVYVLEGELVLLTDAGEQTLVAGACAGFPGGSTDAHCMINRSAAPARFLEVGTRMPREDLASYPDDDVAWVREGEALKLTHKDGTPY